MNICDLLPKYSRTDNFIGNAPIEVHSNRGEYVRFKNIEVININVKRDPPITTLFGHAQPNDMDFDIKILFDRDFIEFIEKEVVTCIYVKLKENTMILNDVIHIGVDFSIGSSESIANVHGSCKEFKVEEKT